MRYIKQALLARIAARLASGLGRPKVSSKDLVRAEFRTSTQRMGLAYTDRIRDIFRLRWLRVVHTDRH